MASPDVSKQTQVWYSPSMHARIQRILRQSVAAFLGSVFGPIFKGENLISIVAIPLSMSLVYYFLGHEKMNEEIGIFLIGFLGLAGAYVFYIVWCLVTAPFVAVRKDRKIGKWEGNTFVYHQPILVFTKKITWEDSLKPFVFTVDGFGAPEKGSFIYWSIDADKAKSNVLAFVDFSHGENTKNWFPMNRGRNAENKEMHGGIKFPPNRKLSIVAKLKERTVPVVFRVTITTFEIHAKKDHR